MRIRRIVSALLIATAAALLAACTPPSDAPLRTGVTSAAAPTADVDGRAAVAFCALLLTQPQLDPVMGAAYAKSGDRAYPLLAQLADEWGRTGDPGARGQVELECRREGLLP